jgi:heme/copper-type cytochrome/quinol oxidase subunit 3
MTSAVAVRSDPPRPLPTGASRMGLLVLLASLGALFIATIFCGWYFRDAGDVVGRTLPDLPSGLWPTSLLLLALSYCAERAARGAQAARPAVFQLQLSLLFGALFLAGQVFCWSQLLAAETGAGVHPMYAFNFYMMTALHAAHVVGGLIYNLCALATAKQGGSVFMDRARNNATYWHFLSIVWVAVLLNLMAIRIPDPEHSFLSPLSLGITGLLLLGFFAYQIRIIEILLKRHEFAFAFFALLPPVAFLHAWARGEELGTQKLALRWGILQAMLMIALMYTASIHLGMFADSYDVGAT